MTPRHPAADTPLPPPVTARGALPLLGHAPALLTRRMDFLQAVRAEGDLVRIRLGSRTAYVVNSPDLIHRVLVTDARRFDKGMIFDRMRPFMGDGLVTSEHHHHRRQRRLIQPAFHRDQVRQYGEHMLRCVDACTADWRSGQVRYLDQDVQRLVVDILATTLFATRRARQAAVELNRSLPAFNHGLTARTLLPAWASRLPLPVLRRFDEAATRLRAMTDELVTDYRALGQSHGDLLSLLLSARDAHTGEGMTDEEIRDEVINLLIAGMETTNSTLAWIVHVLGRDPELERRVHEEVHAVTGGRPLRADDFSRLVHTRHLVCEVLRLHHPLWLIMRRASVPVRLGGARIPAGTNVIFSPATLHRDPHLYPDPLALRPERWAGTSASQRSFIPFGAGARQCIGDGFAWMELTLVTARLVQRWQWRPTSGHRLRPGRSVVIHPGRLPMSLTPRLPVPGEGAPQ